MKKTKVLQVFGSLGMGGAESRMMDVYRNIDKDEYSFDFVTMTDEISFYEDELNELNATVIHIKNPRKVSVFKHINELYRTMKKGKYDAVHSHTSYHCGIVLFAAFLAGIPVRIAHARTSGTKQVSKKTKVFNLIGRALIRLFSTKRLAISHNAGEYLFGKMPFTVVPNTICVSKYTDICADEINEIREELNIPQTAFVIGQIGRFDKMKNHKFTLKWFLEYRKLHTDAFLVLVGDGTLKSETENIATELELQDSIVFTGIRSDVYKLIHIFNVLFFPSVFEGLGGVVLEAQAAGVPTVESSAIPNEADLGLGMVVKCDLNDDITEWINAVEQFRSYKSPNTEIIKEKFEEKGYSIKAVTDIYCKLYGGKSE